MLAGKYRLIEPIGAGGGGAVWRAEHVLLERQVAVKLIEVRGGDPQLADGFLREARVAASVRHPNVVDIVDFGQTDAGQPFMVMELLDGESLLQRTTADRPPLSVDQIVEIALQVLRGLDAVHQAGIVHRDVKPGNVFLSYLDDGSFFARLLDFGISYSIDPHSQLRRGRFGTDERLVTGTPEYMSPEQAEGRPDIDARSDVYAVGVMLYELLSGGRLPYSDPHPGAVLFKVMKGGHLPLQELRPDLPLLSEVVEAALSRDREARPGTARELRRRLAAAAGRGPDVSGRFSRPDRGEDAALGPRESGPRRSAELPTLPQVVPAETADVGASLPPVRSRSPRWAYAALAAALAVGAGVWFAWRPSPSRRTEEDRAAVGPAANPPLPPSATIASEPEARAPGLPAPEGRSPAAEDRPPAAAERTPDERRPPDGSAEPGATVEEPAVARAPGPLEPGPLAGRAPAPTRADSRRDDRPSATKAPAPRHPAAPTEGREIVRELDF